MQTSADSRTDGILNAVGNTENRRIMASSADGGRSTTGERI